MAESSFPFNSIDGDRKYKAEDFRSYFAQLIGNGIILTNSLSLQVESSGDMAIRVNRGGAFIAGAGYLNDDYLTYTLSMADGLLGRIDRVVLRCDYTNRLIYIAIKEGNYALSPIASSLQRDNDVYEIALADVSIGQGVIALDQSNITDLRMDADLCGIVTGLIGQIDATSLFSQFTVAFENWFDEIKGLLGEDPATELADEIMDLKTVASITLTATGWTGTTAPYAQTISVDGITEDDNPLLVSLLSNEASEADTKAYNKAFGYICQGTGTTSDGSVTFRTFNKPSIDIIVGLKGV